MNSAYRLGLIGHPLEHSLSPLLHSAALKALGLAGEYRLYDVHPLPEGRAALRELLERMRAGEIHGLNITIPHKTGILSLLDDLTPPALVIGAVNTIFSKANRLVGDNTDAPGFIADLQRFLADIPDARGREDSKKAIVLGAGGSARAVVFALVQAGWQVSITARRFEQARTLATDLSSRTTSSRKPPVRPFHLDTQSLERQTKLYDLIVNTTPVGMSPSIDASPWPEDIPFPPDAAVYDLVYNPRQTLLVRRAQAAGLPATSGLGMLIEQASLSLECWTGHDTPRQVLWEVGTASHQSGFNHGGEQRA